MLEKCPQCGKELEAGFVRSGGLCLFWSPFGGPKILAVPTREGEFPISPRRGWTGARWPARRCEACGLILMETKKGEFS